MTRYALRLPVGRLPLTAHLKERIYLLLSAARRLGRGNHRPAAPRLTRHPIRTSTAGTGI